MNPIVQREFPLPGSPWNPHLGAADLSGYHVPSVRFRAAVEAPAYLAICAGQPIVSVLGTVRNEALPLDRSLCVWRTQMLDQDVRAQLLVLDDGSDDDPLAVVDRHRQWLREHDREEHIAIRYLRFRGPGAVPERSCSLVMNAAIRQVVETPLVLVQWWDRIPGSALHLDHLVTEHLRMTGIVTSAVSRHVGGSSSVQTMTPSQLEATLALVPWRDDPYSLARVAGPIGDHCRPGEATESSGFCLPIDEFIALGGFDERYVSRASYVNVELWRRMFEGGLVALFVPEPNGANYHQSHACPTNRAKDMGWLHDPLVRRNQGVEWGSLTYLEEA